MQQLAVVDLAGRISSGDDLCILDVREPWEVAIARIADSLHIPMSEIPQRIADIPTGIPVVCVCHHGMRSMQVALYIERQGVGPVFNLAGGIDAWAREIDPACAVY